jgi:hypothetical protein
VRSLACLLHLPVAFTNAIGDEQHVVEAPLCLNFDQAASITSLDRQRPKPPRLDGLIAELADLGRLLGWCQLMP